MFYEYETQKAKEFDYRADVRRAQTAALVKRSFGKPAQPARRASILLSLVRRSLRHAAHSTGSQLAGQAHTA